MFAPMFVAKYIQREHYSQHGTTVEGKRENVKPNVCGYRITSILDIHYLFSKVRIHDILLSFLHELLSICFSSIHLKSREVGSAHPFLLHVIEIS